MVDPVESYLSLVVILQNLLALVVLCLHVGIPKIWGHFLKLWDHVLRP